MIIYKATNLIKGIAVIKKILAAADFEGEPVFAEVKFEGERCTYPRMVDLKDIELT